MKQNIQSPQRVLAPKAGIELLERLIVKAQKLTADGAVSDDDQQSWMTQADEYFKRIFGPGSSHWNNIQSATYGEIVLGKGRDFYERKNAETLEVQIRRIRDAIEVLELDVELTTPAATAEPIAQETSNTGIFIVHGHDGELKHSVARLLERQGLSVTILHERPDRGRTIIE